MYTKKSDEQLYSIGNVSKAFGVSDNTIRRMEAAGLLKPHIIKESGYGYYDYNNIARIKLILSLKSLGFVNKEIEEFFKTPGDFTKIYDKLYEKKLAIDNLLVRSQLLIKPSKPGEIFLIHHKEIPFFAKTYSMFGVTDLDVLNDYSSRTLSEAVMGSYPIDYSRPITILTPCDDAFKFNPFDPVDLTFCVPLREKVNKPGVSVIPSRNVLSFAYYKGIFFDPLLDNLKEYMTNNNLRQSDVFGVTFGIGRYMSDDITKDDCLFHIMIPCEEI